MSPWPGQFNRKDQALGSTLIVLRRRRIGSDSRTLSVKSLPWENAAEAMGLRISMYVIPWTDLRTRWFQDGESLGLLRRSEKLA